MNALMNALINMCIYVGNSPVRWWTAINRL